MWRLTPGQALACREWDGEAVLYNELSGSTHLLDGAALDLLHALRDEPADAATLAMPIVAIHHEFGKIRRSTPTFRATRNGEWVKTVENAKICKFLVD